MLDRKEIEEALRYQDYVADLLYDEGIPIGIYSSYKYQIEKGESKAGVEIKYDKRMAETGNIYIEVAERHDPEGQFVKSGILRKDNTILYAIGNYYKTLLIAKKDLLKIYKKYPRKVTNTSIGYVIPVKDIEDETIMKWKDGRRYEKENEQTSEIGTR